MPTKTQLLSDPALLQWHAKGQYLKLGGHSIFIIDETISSTNMGSDRPTLFLIHGFPTSSWDWAPMWNSLLKHYRLVCLDMLGFGFSDKPNRRDYTIHGQADLIEELITKLELKELHLLAHDYGDTVAQELLSRQLDYQSQAKPSPYGQWRSCTFLNGGLFPETHKALLVQKLLLSPAGRYINALNGFSTFSKSFSRVFGDTTKPNSTELKQFWEVINYNDGRHVFHNLITYMHDRKKHRERWVNSLKSSPIPLALINGSLDPVSGRHMVARYKQLSCRLDYIDELADIGHYPQFEAPSDVSRSVLTFMNSL